MLGSGNSTASNSRFHPALVAILLSARRSARFFAQSPQLDGWDRVEAEQLRSLEAGVPGQDCVLLIDQHRRAKADKGDGVCKLPGVCFFECVLAFRGCGLRAVTATTRSTRCIISSSFRAIGVRVAAHVGSRRHCSDWMKIVRPGFRVGAHRRWRSLMSSALPEGRLRPLTALRRRFLL
jgi:hypothetical protein